MGGTEGGGERGSGCSKARRSGCGRGREGVGVAEGGREGAGQREGEGWQLTSWVLHILVVLAGLKVGEGGVAGRGEGHHLEHQGGGGEEASL